MVITNKEIGVSNEDIQVSNDITLLKYWRSRLLVSNENLNRNLLIADQEPAKLIKDGKFLKINLELLIEINRRLKSFPWYKRLLN